MTCSHCDRLQREFDRAERVYARAYGVFTSSALTPRASEYNRLKAIADEARIDSEVARLELEQHTRIHARAN